MQEAFKKVEKDAFRFAGENEKLKKTIEGMQEELDRLRQDASVMRSILDRAAISATPAPAPTEKPKYVPKPFKKPEEEPAQISAFDNLPPLPEEELAPAPTQPTAPVPAATETPVAETAPAEQSAPTEEPKKKPKSHIGNMFDLLTFSDV